MPSEVRMLLGSRAARQVARITHKVARCAHCCSWSNSANVACTRPRSRLAPQSLAELSKTRGSGGGVAAATGRATLGDTCCRLLAELRELRLQHQHTLQQLQQAEAALAAAVQSQGRSQSRPGTAIGRGMGGGGVGSDGAGLGSMVEAARAAVEALGIDREAAEAAVMWRNRFLRAMLADVQQQQQQQQGEEGAGGRGPGGLGYGARGAGVGAARRQQQQQAREQQQREQAQQQAAMQGETQAPVVSVVWHADWPLGVALGPCVCGTLCKSLLGTTRNTCYG